MSSMTDIVFLLLIFFIILSTLVSPFGENIKLPSKGGSSSSESKPYVLSVKKAGAYKLNSQSISFEGLDQELAAQKDDPNKPQLTLQVDALVPAGETVKLFSLAKKHQFEVVLMAQIRNR